MYFKMITVKNNNNQRDYKGLIGENANSVFITHFVLFCFLSFIFHTTFCYHSNLLSATRCFRRRPFHLMHVISQQTLKVFFSANL